MNNVGISQDFMSSQENYIELNDYGNDEPKYEITNGETSFTVKELYVYQISD